MNYCGFDLLPEWWHGERRSSMRLKVGGRRMTMSALSPGTPELETPFGGFKPRRRFKPEQRGIKQERCWCLRLRRQNALITIPAPDEQLRPSKILSLPFTLEFNADHRLVCTGLQIPASASRWKRGVWSGKGSDIKTTMGNSGRKWSSTGPAVTCVIHRRQRFSWSRSARVKSKVADSCENRAARKHLQNWNELNHVHTWLPLELMMMLSLLLLSFKLAPACVMCTGILETPEWIILILIN